MEVSVHFGSMTRTVEVYEQTTFDEFRRSAQHEYDGCLNNAFELRVGSGAAGGVVSNDQEIKALSHGDSVMIVPDRQTSAVIALTDAGVIPSESSLFDAAYRGDATTCANLIHVGVDPSIPSSTGWPGHGETALIVAAHEGHTEACRAMIEASVDIEGIDNDETTALFHACLRSKPECAKALIALGADVNTTSAEGATCLRIAVKNKQLEIVQAVLAAGADVNSAPDGVSPLLQCACVGSAEIAEVLLDYGADLDFKCMYYSKTALEIAEKYGHTHLVNVLKGRQDKAR